MSSATVAAVTDDRWTITSKRPAVQRALTWLAKRQRAGESVTSRAMVEWDRKHGKALFDWDDASAADAHRIHQAAHFIGHFAYRLNGFRVRGWISVPDTSQVEADEDETSPKAGNAFHHVSTIIDRPPMRARVIASVTRRLETQAATLRFFQLSPDEQSQVLRRVEQAMAE